MPNKVVVTFTYEKGADKQLDSALEPFEKQGTVSAVIIPPLSTLQIVARNFCIGMARGLGFFIGGTVIIGLIIWTIQSIISMNIPYLTELFKQLLTIIKTT